MEAKYYTRRQLMLEEASIKPYIQNGLLLHLDSDDITSESWIDRVGNKVFVYHHAAPDSSGVGVRFNTTAYSSSGSSYIDCSSRLSVTPLAGTVEICARRIAIRSRTESEFIYMTDTANRLCYVVAANGTYAMIANHTSGIAPRAVLNGRTLEKFTHSVNASRCMYNGVVGTLGANAQFARNGTGTTIGCRPDGHYAFQGIIYQVRVYNRKLSEAEMLWNQRQDAKRYGIVLG